LLEGVRRRLEGHIAYLEANPRKELQPVFVIAVERIERTLASILAQRARGETPKPWKPKPGKARVPISRKWNHSPRPAWMSDPSLLPKRPPGKE
jgi:hypothetical protein